MGNQYLLKLSFLGLFSLPLFAGTMENINASPKLPFYIGASGGYGVINGGYNQDGNFSQGRLTLGLDAREYKNILFGAEMGLQSGNTMRLYANPTLIEETGGLPVQSNLKPFLDFLVTTKTQLQTARPLFLIMKGGVAYRQLQLENRTSSQDSLNKVNGEFQGGLGYSLTKNVMLTALYQGIYNANNAGVNLNKAGDIIIASIPSQNAGFLGIQYSF